MGNYYTYEYTTPQNLKLSYKPCGYNANESNVRNILHEGRYLQHKFVTFTRMIF